MFKNRPFVVINSTTKAVTLEVFWCNFHPFAIIFPIKFLRKKYVHFSSDFIPSHVFACIHIYIWIWWHILVGHLNFHQPRSGMALQRLELLGRGWGHLACGWQFVKPGFTFFLMWVYLKNLSQYSQHWVLRLWVKRPIWL